MNIFLISILLLVAASGAAVVFTRDIASQPIGISFFGLILAIMFMAFQAPDVALSQIVIGAVGLPLMILLALAKLRRDGQLREKADGQEKEKMRPPLRLAVFLLGALGLAFFWIFSIVHLPGPADLRDRYLLQIDAITFPQRNITDLVTAVNFDFRGFDTLGEEFILFASVIGSLVLLRQADEKNADFIPDAIAPSRDVGPSDAMRLWILAMVGPKIAFGIYIVLHGQLTPGGGFQGGVILASAALIIYLGHNFQTFKRIMLHPLIEFAEGFGAAAFLVLGFIALLYQRPFLTNVLPLGKTGELSSGGTIPLISASTGIEVMGGFVLLLFAFLQETLSAATGK